MRHAKKIALGLFTLLLLASTAGCIEALAAGVGGYGAGYLAGLTSPIESTCYKNNELIDCSEVPT
jgi:hypothetical protein